MIFLPMVLATLQEKGADATRDGIRRAFDMPESFSASVALRPAVPRQIVGSDFGTAWGADSRQV